MAARATSNAPMRLATSRADEVGLRMRLTFTLYVQDLFLWETERHCLRIYGEAKKCQ